MMALATFILNIIASILVIIFILYTIIVHRQLWQTVKKLGRTIDRLDVSIEADRVDMDIVKTSLEQLHTKVDNYGFNFRGVIDRLDKVDDNVNRITANNTIALTSREAQISSNNVNWNVTSSAYKKGKGKPKTATVNDSNKKETTTNK